MKILIIEDEPFVAKDLQNLVMRLEPKATILDIISSVEAAKRWLAQNPPPDLVFSDIQLSDGISFEIFEGMHLNCPVIFTTAYDAYAIRAFKLNSVDYLLKPVDEKELAAALLKYRTLTSETILSEQLKSLLGQLGGSNTLKKYKERFLCLHRNTLVPVINNEIAFFHKEELIYLVTMANEKYICEHQALDEVENLLNPELYYRVNRQFIIHIQSVSRVKTTHKGLTVQLKPPFNTEIDISREKASSFKSWLGQEG